VGHNLRQARGANDPDISVVICTLGVAAVSETVDSVLESARAAGCTSEIVVVWQGPEPAPRLNGVVVERVFPAGLSYARNRGLEAARAPLVAFVDDDEVVDPGWLAALIDAFRSIEAAGVFGPVAPRDERGLPYCNYNGGGALRIVSGRRTLPWGIGTGGNMAFRRDELLAMGGFDLIFGIGAVACSAEDTDAILRTLRGGESVAWTPDAVVYHPTKTVPERLASRFPYAYGIGKLARRHRDPVLAARYGKSILDATVRAAAARDSRRLREVRETLRGFVAGVGFRARPRSPEAPLDHAPAAIESALAGAQVEPLEPLFRPEPHYMYRVGDDRLLHVYVDPKPRLRDGFAVRERIRAESRLPGIPQLHASAESTDAFWVLEERLRGHEPQPREVGRWFPAAAEWSLKLGGEGGAPVREGAWWNDESAAALAVAPPELRAEVSVALETVGGLPGRHLHGDFQRKNIVIGERVTVIDWERAYDLGPPGLDLFFLALMARADRPDREVARAVAAGRDPSWISLQPLLRRAGLHGVDLRRYVLAALAVWAADEQDRVAALGAPQERRTRYRELLFDLGRELA
jgi:GT2 family glycosyltransferase